MMSVSVACSGNQAYKDLKHDVNRLISQTIFFMMGGMKSLNFFCLLRGTPTLPSDPSVTLA